MHRLVLMALAALLVFALPLSAPAQPGKLVQTITFTDYEEGSIEDWLAIKGFALEQDAKRRNRIDFDVTEQGLVLDTKRKSLGIMPNETVNLHEFSFIEVDWGVDKQPAGASYEQKVRNEAIMLFVFMGDERQPSGSMFIPDSPYFVGLFLCSGDDRKDHPYVGAYFKKGGRYVCVDKPDAGELVTSRFDLMRAYRDYFDKEEDDDPGISGIALGLDTKKASDDGSARAFIREIRLYR